MPLSSFKPFFYLTEPSLNSNFNYGLNGFFSSIRGRAKPLASYRLIAVYSDIQNTLRVGQLPCDNYSNLLVPSSGGSSPSVVTCGEYMEQSKTLFHYIWRYSDAKHLHMLPGLFSRAHLETLKRILTALSKKDLIYIHYKEQGGGLLIALLRCIKDDAIKNQLQGACNRQEISAILVQIIHHINVFNELTPPIKINDNELTLGIEILQMYIHSWNNPGTALSIEDNDDDLFSQEPESQEARSQEIRAVEVKGSLTAQNYLMQLSHSNLYKFLCNEAYKNKKTFRAVQKFGQELYNDAAQREEDLFDFGEITKKLGGKVNNIIIQLVHLFAISNEFRIRIQETCLPSLLGFNLYCKILNSSVTYKNKIHAFKELLKCLEYEVNDRYQHILHKYPVEIQKLGWNLYYSILDASIPNEKKAEFLDKMVNCLEHPLSQSNIEVYEKLKKSTLSGSSHLQIIGAIMMLLGIAVILVATIAAFISPGGSFVLFMSALGGGAFGFFQTIIGNLFYNWGKTSGIAHESFLLFNEIERMPATISQFQEEQCDLISLLKECNSFEAFNDIRQKYESLENHYERLELPFDQNLKANDDEFYCLLEEKNQEFNGARTRWL